MTFRDCCPECGDEFHYDDVGGYNPPCSCCGVCRSCCRAANAEDDDWQDYELRPGVDYDDTFVEPLDDQADGDK